MSWDDYRRRRAAINLVLAHASAHPHEDLAYDNVPEVKAVFASRTELVLALQYDWSQVLWAQIELLTLDTANGPQDANEVCGLAWRAAAAQRPTLRRLLDRHLGECHHKQALARQEQLFISAGIGHSSQGARDVSAA